MNNEAKCHICKNLTNKCFEYKQALFVICEECENMFLEGELLKYCDRCIANWVKR